MTTELSGSTALVTGGTSGIGRATAAALAGLGAHVVVSGRDAGRGAEVVEGIRAAGGKADFVAADLTDASSARSLADRAREIGGHVDVLVNSAGIFPTGPTADISETDFDRVYATNVKVPFFLVAELAPEMAARGRGAIVNVSTIVAKNGMTGMALYGSSKAAVELMTKAWAAEYGPSGVRVNAVSPGPTRTEGTAAFGDGLDELAAAGPAGRVASPEEIAAAIAFLAADESSFVHGAILPVDGGRAAV
ncbi:SDR family NAD(P)-dependent oxidoreductase [Amycolatopsis vastitatis]|uniref:Short-chain dehydrogenase n=1 Tax=Amycolatopsis vastitatis TaxID=1905142 RepID=A0A229SSQ2_9PSEU|nr:SDR family oxidoreductase [Amycolatopsis vastitatis]OXM61913.1 short-chain dehydrogenase [Amycolatopsis vastitatis]